MNTTYLASAFDLDTWSASPWSDGWQLGNLRALDTLEVTTKNTVYDITLMDPRSGEVLSRKYSLVLIRLSIGRRCHRLGRVPNP